MKVQSLPAESPTAPATIVDDVRAAHVELKKADVELEKAEQEAQRSADDARRCRHAAQQRRIEIGRLLMTVRPTWPERGPTAKGWGDFLREVGIHEQSAREWMDLVEAINISKPADGGLEMTRAEAQEILRAAKANTYVISSATAEPADDHEEPDSTAAPKHPKEKAAPGPRSGDAPRVANQELCRLRVRATVIRMIKTGTADAAMLRAGFDDAEEVRVFEQAFNPFDWRAFKLAFRADAGAKEAAFLRELANAIESIAADDAAEALS